MVILTSAWHCRFSSGLTLQAKVDLSTQPEEHTSLRSSSKRVSFRRRVGSGSQASSPVSEGHTLGRYLALNYAYNSPPSVNSLIIIISIFSSPSTPGETSIQLTGGIGGAAYDATSLHIFIREAFPGAVLLEEHQVCTSAWTQTGIAILCQLVLYDRPDTGCCDISASKCWHLMVIHLQTDWEQQGASENCGLLCQSNNPWSGDERIGMLG